MEWFKKFLGHEPEPLDYVFWALPVVLLFMILFMAVSSAATWEQAKMMAYLYGVDYENEDVIQYYYDKLNEQEQTQSQPNPTPTEPTEQVIKLNETHELVIKDGYNITRSIFAPPPEPTVTPTQTCSCEELMKQIVELERRIEVLEGAS